MKKLGYKYKQGTRGPLHIDPAIVADELAKAKRGDELHPSDVVDIAKDPQNALHDFFTWDDSEAARLRRLDEARYLIRSIEVIYEKPKSGKTNGVDLEYETMSSREYQTLHVNGPSQPYRQVEDILGDDESRIKLVEKAYRLAVRWRNTYAGLRELAEVFEAIDSVEL
jgi:hypothetical protein